MQAQYRRKLSPGTDYDRYFRRGELKRTDPMLSKSGSVFTTIRLMEKIVHETLQDTALIAPELRGSNLKQTCSNTFDFVYRHIQYKLDKAGVEQLRRPLRSWEDRKEGVDCDCYSIFISSILTNLGIEHYFRMTKYANDWQHIYVVVPIKPNSNLNQTADYYTIDCVVDRFNNEEPYSAKHDRKMSTPIQFLNGTPSVGNIVAPGFGNEFTDFGKKPLAGLGAVDSAATLYLDMLERMRLHFENTLDQLKANPKALPAQAGSKFRKQVETLLANWHDGQKRTELLNQYAVESDDLAGFGSLAGWPKSMFKAIGNGISNAASYVGDKVGDAAKAVATGVKNAAEWTGDKAGDAWEGIKNAAEWTFEKVIQLNPLSILMRNGLLLAFKINLFHMSERLGYGYWTEQEAQSKGLEMNEWRKLKEKLDDVHKIWRGLQGDEDSLQKNILQGWEHGVKKHDLLKGLGAAAETGTAAAMPIILKIVAGLATVAINKMLSNANTSKPENLDYPQDGNINMNTPFPQSEAEYYANLPRYNNPQPIGSDSTMYLVGGGILLLLLVLKSSKK